jgi:hypothetical protein
VSFTASVQARHPPASSAPPSRSPSGSPAYRSPLAARGGGGRVWNFLDDYPELANDFDTTDYFHDAFAMLPANKRPPFTWVQPRLAPGALPSCERRRGGAWAGGSCVCT